MSELGCVFGHTFRLKTGRITALVGRLTGHLGDTSDPSRTQRRNVYRMQKDLARIADPARVYAIEQDPLCISHQEEVGE